MNHLEKIEEIKNHPDVNISGMYEGKLTYWEYYFDITGYYKGNYFSILFSKSKHEDNNVRVSGATEEREQFIKDFGLC